MEENKSPATLPKTDDARDQELFAAIGKGKKRRKIRRIIVTILILALLAGGIYAAVIYGRQKVREQMSNMGSATSVKSYTVNTGSVNTTVSGSGQLADVGTEAITLPKGVKVDKLLVSAGDAVREGDLLATVDRSSVVSAMGDVQKSINDLDSKLRTAVNESVSPIITAGVNGRIKAIYVKVGDDVAAVMSKYGALALVSMDGNMALEIPAGDLMEGKEVTIKRSNSRLLKGKVDQIIGDTAVILVTDNGPMLDEEVTVLDAKKKELGSGKLYIHSPLKVTGYAGTVSAVTVKENSAVYSGSAVVRLKNTNYSVNYESYLRDRQDLEKDLLELIEISRTGAIRAPFEGTVSSVQYKDPNSSSGSSGSSSGSDSTESGGDGYGVGGSGSDGSSDNSSSSGSDSSGLVTLAPDKEMSLTISVDEANILTLELGQTAQVTINSIGEMFTGEVTEINRTGTGEAGVTNYTAVITMPKDPRMMTGMSAKAVVRIQGVAGAILIPVEALHQTKNASFVYTSYDEESGEIGGAVSVTVGLSDGSMVEITEGLQEGDTVYYTVTVDPWAAMFGTSGDASEGDAWMDDGAMIGEAGALDDEEFDTGDDEEFDAGDVVFDFDN